MPVTEQTRPQTRAPAETREPPKPTPVRRASSHARRLFLAVLMAVVSVNVWTGAPLLSLWIGSKVQGSGPPSMSAIAATAGALVVLVIVLVAVMNRLSAAYDREAGTVNVRQHVPWLRSMRGERPAAGRERPKASVLDRILVFSVVTCVALFEVWFFFFSGSPIGGGGGR